MRVVALSALLCAAAPQAYAQATEPAPAPAGEQAQSGSGQSAASSGVTVYPPSFFAESRPNTALDMIERLPGFTFESGDTSVRGFAGAAGNVVIDGQRPASKSDNLSDIVSRIPASQVERIELIRGGAPGMDMQGRSVLVNVVRRRADSFQQTVTAAAHYFLGTGRTIPNFRYQATRQTGQRTWEAAIGRGVSMDDSIGRGTRVTRNALGDVNSFEQAVTDAGGGGWNARGSYKAPLIGGTFRGNASVSESTFESSERFSLDGEQTRVEDGSDSLNVEAGANYDRALAARWQLETVLLHKQGRSEYVATSSGPGEQTVFTSDADTGESIARGLLRFRRSDTVSFEGGGEAAFNFREGHVTFTADGSRVTIPSSDVRVEERRAESFLQANWRPTPKLAVEAGSRFEWSTISQAGGSASERSFFYPKPRLLLSWSPTENDQYRFRVEREVGQLNFGDFVSSANLTNQQLVAGNPELEPDKTWVYEAVAERRFWKTGALVVSARHEVITDAIDRLPIFVDADSDGVVDEVFDAPGNIGDGTFDILEVDLTLPLGRFGVPGGEFKLELEANQSEVTDPTTGEKRRISGRRPEDYQFTFRQDLPERKLTYSVYYLAGFRETYYRFNEISTVRLDNFYGASVEYKPTPRLSLLLEYTDIGKFLLTRQRVVYAGPRNTNPVSFIEDFNTVAQQRLFFRIRRQFGA